MAEPDTQSPIIPHKEPATGTDKTQAARTLNPILGFLKILGPGFITGASDDDPSGIGTYTVAGASQGFATLWMAFFTFPLMASVQFICAKIGLVSGEGVASLLRKHYSRWLLYPAVLALVIANTINAGADLGAIGAAFQLLLPFPAIWFIIPSVVLILALQIFGSYRLIANIFKWLTLSLFAYIGAALLAKPDWGEVLRATFIPTFQLNPAFIATVVAILGTTISPYLFFWQADQEVEEKISVGRKRLWQRRGATDSELRYAWWDVNIGMFFSNLVMYFIILATAATLFKAGQTHIQSATDAAKALRPLAGDAASLLLALGLIGSGFLAVPILTGSAAFGVAETFNWRRGLNEKPWRARPFYAVIVIATLVGLSINFLGINPIAALFWTAVINGFLAPPLLILIMLLANSRKIMGKHRNGWVSNTLGWITVVVMVAAAGALVVTWGH
ncbi:MAG TPA: divalent metal cation transporter [Ktedonobacterales bacterium]|jgi:NRAMP (natural resistance-associated macrophage protein)-like metal ion transporter|nr:divalent metal cation transporter [Ktedonobacterales bacterium]